MTSRKKAGSLERFDALRFEKWTQWGAPSEHRPDLGPCLLWMGGLSHGYGQFSYNNRHGYAHRYAWERKHGTITDALTVDHLCRVRNCVNVNHMERREYDARRTERRRLERQS